MPLPNFYHIRALTKNSCFQSYILFLWVRLMEQINFLFNPFFKGFLWFIIPIFSILICEDTRLLRFVFVELFRSYYFNLISYVIRLKRLDAKHSWMINLSKMVVKISRWLSPTRRIIWTLVKNSLIIMRYWNYCKNEPKLSN